MKTSKGKRVSEQTHECRYKISRFFLLKAYTIIGTSFKLKTRTVSPAAAITNRRSVLITRSFCCILVLSESRNKLKCRPCKTCFRVNRIPYFKNLWQVASQIADLQFGCLVRLETNSERALHEEYRRCRIVHYISHLSILY